MGPIGARRQGGRGAAGLGCPVAGPEPVQRRRQPVRRHLRLHGGRGRGAPAEPRRRDQPPARLARRLARRLGRGSAGPRRIRGRHALAGRQAPVGGDSQPARRRMHIALWEADRAEVVRTGRGHPLGSGGREAVDSGQWTVDGGQWTVDGKQWTESSGQWAEGRGCSRYSCLMSGKTPSSLAGSTVHCSLLSALRSPTSVHCPPSTVHRPPSTVHRPPSTVHCPLSTVHCFPSTVHCFTPSPPLRPAAARRGPRRGWCPAPTAWSPTNGRRGRQSRTSAAAPPSIGGPAQSRPRSG